MSTCPQYLIDACAAANAADDAYSNAVTRAGYKSRWDVPYPLNATVPESVRQAQAAKHTADGIMHDAFERARREKSPNTTVV
jgi:hypothetical protein